jgi:hypothetical protein
VLGSDCLQLFAYIRSVWQAFAPDCLWIDTDKSAGLALGDLMNRHCPQSCIQTLILHRQLVPSRSLGTALSDIVLTSRRFSLAFASFNAFDFATSSTSIPPYLDLYF